MGFFDAIGKTLGSIGKAIFPSSMSDIGRYGDIGELSTQMVSRAEKSFKRIGLRMSEIDKTMQRVNKTMAALSVELAAMKYQEPICTHESIEEALRQR